MPSAAHPFRGGCQKLAYTLREQEKFTSVRLFVLSNRRLARAQAAFVALLYVFLCTFGTLTHTHATLRGETESAGFAASVSESKAPRQAAISAGRVHPQIAYCGFCEWQANSVSAALTPFHITRPVLRRVLVLLPLPALLHSTYLAGFSSRAPPLA